MFQRLLALLLYNFFCRYLCLNMFSDLIINSLRARLRIILLLIFIVPEIGRVPGTLAAPHTLFVWIKKLIHGQVLKPGFLIFPQHTIVTRGFLCCIFHSTVNCERGRMLDPQHTACYPVLVTLD